MCSSKSKLANSQAMMNLSELIPHPTVAMCVVMWIIKGTLGFFLFFLFQYEKQQQQQHRNLCHRIKEMIDQINACVININPSEVSQSVRLFATPWTVAHQAPQSVEIFQASVLEWVAISSSRGSSQPRD